MVRDPFFGAPLSPSERRLWASILGAGRVRHRSRAPFGNGQPFSGAGATPTASETLELNADSADKYPWLYPTPDFQNFDKYGAVALPAKAGNPANIGDGNLANGNTLPFTVPQGFNGYIKAIAIEFVPNGSTNLWTPGVVPAQLAFVISMNGQALPDYGNIAYSPGDIDSPTPIAGLAIKENTQIVVTVKNIGITVDTQFVAARLQGYFYGKHNERQEQI